MKTFTAEAQRTRSGKGFRVQGSGSGVFRFEHTPFLVFLRALRASAVNS